MPNQIKVVSSHIEASGGSVHRVNDMSDGTVWSCDYKGENWKKITPLLEELTRKFHEAQTTPQN